MHLGTYAADLAKFGLWFWILVRFGEQQGNNGQNKTKINMKHTTEQQATPFEDDCTQVTLTLDKVCKYFIIS